MRYASLLTLLASLCVVVQPSPLTAQPVDYGVTMEVAGATGSTLPFWLHANRGGLYGTDAPLVLTHLHAYRPTRRAWRLTLGFGVDLAARASDGNSAVFARHLYGRARYGPFVLTAGRAPHTAGLVDSTLSLGSMVLSPNATPVPAVSLAFDDVRLATLPGDVRLFARGYFSHGWLENDRFVRSPYLHGKYLYLRIDGGDLLPATGYAGINHYVVWGGTHPTLGPLPSALDDFIDVVLARAGDEGQAPGGEVINALGNTVASYDFGLTIHLPGTDLTAYRQFFIDTSTAADFRNPWDGLWGVRLHWHHPDRLVRSILWEHVNTKRQGSRKDLQEPDGADNYYNNFLYRSGWTYMGRTLGLPLILPDPTGERDGVVNNIIVAHHLGLEGQLTPRLAYRTLLTYSRNYGARDNCNDNGCFGEATLITPRRDQVSWLLELYGPLTPHLDLHAALAFDAGAVHPDRAGLLLGITWRPAR